MAINTTWSILDMDRTTSSGGVFLVRWACKAKSDGTPSYDYSQSSKLETTPDPSASDYIAYTDLTENDVLTWVYASLVTTDEEDVTETPAEAKARVELRCSTKVQAQIDTASANSTGMPWAAE